MGDEQDGAPRAAAGLKFLDGGGTMGALIAASDWSASPLGPPERWPSVLKSTVAMMLPAAAQIVLFWGPDLVALYNDDYAPTIGDKHPRALGRPARENWAELWDDLEPLLSSVCHDGETVSAADRPFYIERHGEGETVYFDISYSPVRDQHGAVCGVLCLVKETTERVVGERRLRESEQALLIAQEGKDKLVAERDAILSQLTEGVIVTDRDGRIVFVNRSAEMLHGVAKLDVAPEDYSETYHLFTEDGVLYPPEELPLARAVLRGETVTDARWRIRRPDGSEILAIGSAHPLEIGGENAGGVLTLRDDTERHDAEMALRESEERYRALFEAIDEGFCIIEFLDGPHGPLSDYEHIQANPAYLANAGIDDIVGKRLREIVGESEADAWAAIYREVLVTGEPVRFERELVETGRHLELAAFRLEPAERRQVAVLFQDISARKKAETALQDLNETLEQRVAERTKERDRLWTLSEDMLSRADYSGMMSAVNPAWAKVLGWAEEKLLTTGYAEFMHSDDAGSTLAAIEGMARTGQPTRFQNRILTADGDWKPIDWTVAPEPDGVNFIAVGRDLTEDKARERELELAQEALRQAQKMETLGQLTGGVAHDFNNLLQIVSGNIGLIQRGLPEADARLRRAAENAARGAERAAVLTQRLLAFSRRQPLAPKPIDPNKMVGGMSELLHRTLGEMIEVETVLAPRLWTIEADPNQLENAILNLAINARDAMPDGGKLTIETCNTHLDRAYVAQNAEVSVGQYVCLCVTDSGAGMDEETVARAFEPFFTTKEVGKGTGLGLSMVYGFVKQSDGHLKIYSECGEGTTVKIYLPRLLGEQPEAEDGGDELIPAGGQDETILVCEDDADVRAFTVEVLRELGYRVLEAEDGPSTLALLEQTEQVDLLFTDVVLPNGMTGAVLAREALARRPGLKVLYTTGYARNAIVHHGRLDPGVELITKPFSYADLAARVRDVLDGQP